MTTLDLKSYRDYIEQLNARVQFRVVVNHGSSLSLSAMVWPPPPFGTDDFDRSNVLGSVVLVLSAGGGHPCPLARRMPIRSLQNGAMKTAPKIIVCPRVGWVEDAVRAGGGIAAGGGDAIAVIWTDPTDSDGLLLLLDRHPQVEWVQLLWAGIEPFTGILDHDRLWTCGKGVYADPVAEHALMLALVVRR
jgi:hypothetical protein